jgi:hypothetical protein
MQMHPNLIKIQVKFFSETTLPNLTGIVTGWFSFGELMSGGFPHCYCVILSPDLSMCTMPMSMTIYKVNISLACLQNEII